MTATTLPNMGMQYAWTSGEDGWNTGMDANLLKLDTLVQGKVISAAVSTPPGSPTTGDRYIVASSPTGAWSGHAKDIAIYVNGGWTFYTPSEGWRVWNAATSSYYKYASSAWSADTVTLDTDGTLAANSDLVAASQKATKTYVDTATGNINSYAKGVEFVDDFLFCDIVTSGQSVYVRGGSNYSNFAITDDDIALITNGSRFTGVMGVRLNSTGNGVGALVYRSETGLVGSGGNICSQWRTGDVMQMIFHGSLFDQLPDGSNNFVYRIGFSYAPTLPLDDSDPFADLSGAHSIDGAGAFFYVDNSSSYWKCVSGVLTTIETTTTSVTASLNSAIALKVVVGTTGTVTFYINDTLVATHSTGVITTGKGLTEQIAIRNNALTAVTNKTVIVDAIGFKHTLASQRTGFSFS